MSLGKQIRGENKCLRLLNLWKKKHFFYRKGYIYCSKVFGEKKKKTFLNIHRDRMK